MINYIGLQCMALGLGYLIYILLLKREKSFTFNRFFLLGSLVLCLLMPALKLSYGIELPSNNFMEYGESIKAMDAEYMEAIHETSLEEQNVAITKSNGKLSLKDWVLWVYITVTSIFLFRFGRNLFLMFQKIKGKPIAQKSGMFILKENSISKPYSFFQFLFVSSEAVKADAFPEEILIHESVHSQQFHSIDRLLCNLLECFFWFNPFVWLYGKAIAENHEFLADRGVVQSGKSLNDYVNLLIQYKTESLSHPLSSGFGSNFTKKRVLMMFQDQKKKSHYLLKGCLALITLLLILGLSSFSPGSNDPEKPFVVLIDPGHGGKDPGANVQGIVEKDFNLKFSQKIEKLSGTKNVKIILTRVEDEFISLDHRVHQAKDLQPDLLVSIHANASMDESARGFEIYYSPKSEEAEKSQIFAERFILTYENSNIGLIPSREKLMKMANPKILKDSGVPGLNLLIGFISNPEDAAKMMDDDYQNQLAEHIYDSLVEISKIP